MVLLNNLGKQEKRQTVEVVGGDNTSSLRHIDFGLDQVEVVS